MIWLGDEDSLAQYQRYQDRLDALSPSDAKLLMGSGGDEEDNPVSVDKLDSGLALMQVSGTTITESNAFTRWAGLISYSDIRQRVAQLADDESVKSILMSVNSNGGAADGVSATSRFIRQVNSHVKPVFVHTSGTMASAAMWYGTAGEAVFADEDARLGSVGAIRIHTEYVDMLKARGVTAKVFRSARYKALGQREERLSEEADAQIQGDLNALHDHFVTGLSNNLSLNPGDVQATIANGKMFSAGEALQHRLISKVMTFDELVAKLSAGLRQ